ncbi:MAG: hypothetical protein P4L90_25785 [Rhodopila sp.]|nr:hypothetical protein [Rhodopila sp.]
MLEGLPIAGYRPQSEERVSLVNENKQLEERCLRALDYMMKTGIGDPRWTAVARTQLEQGFMAMNRAIFQPSRVALPSDGTTPKSAVG